MPTFRPFDPRRRRALRAAANAAGAGLLSACSPATLVQAITPTGHFTLEDDVAYGDDPRQRLDVYIPRAPSAPTGGAPVVVFFYGGSWQRGNRKLYAFVGEALSRVGFVAVLPDYRVWPQVAFPVFVEDGARAVAWAVAQAARFSGDARKVVVAGHSAGGHIAALLALDDHYLGAAGTPGVLRGMAGLAGAYDFLPLTDPTLQALFATARSIDLTQPINFAHRSAPPLWLAHGTSDRVVLPRNSTHLAERTRALGGRAELALYEGYGHFDIVARLAAPLRPSSTLQQDLAGFVRSVTSTPQA